MGFFNSIKEGDVFVARSDGRGGVNLTPKGSGGNSNLGGCLLILVLIVVLLAFLSVVLLPAALALYAFTQDDDAAKRIRVYVINIFVVLALVHYFGQDLEILQPVFDLLMRYQVLFGIIFVLNLVGLASALLGLIGSSEAYNKLATRFAMLGIVLYAVVVYGDKILEKSFTKEQLDIACDCYRVSVGYTNTAYDDLSSESAKKLRSRCYDLFDEERTAQTAVTDAAMKKACDIRKNL